MEFEHKLEKLISEVNNKNEINNYVFLSLGKSSVKAQVKLLKKIIILNKIFQNWHLNLKRNLGNFLSGLN
ncbi:hypothetical protein HMPREF2135_09550 [Staphylococcus haemolyticus DNF00585]|nr:hypothetical protein [Staphylococcus haemolyticus]KGF26021.1 hypothetical protein HMPREF2135_09550 [Staphylococcus haemolyticus DNF00585]